MQILIADDETKIRDMLKRLLEPDHEVLLCEDGAAALESLKAKTPDVVITDNQMPGLSGIELIRKGKELSPSTAFLLMTAFGSVKQAVEAIRLGAEDYFLKPFELDEIEHRIRRIEELRAWKSENALRSSERIGVDRLVGRSKAMESAREFIRKVALAPSPVLLLGPSGSGKEVVAKAIHESGPRVSRPFIAINCASLNEQLMESELFGHEKGAFTGAAQAKPGKFELAAGGTLFLDEIGELGTGLQAKLLRVLQEKEFFRVGGTRQMKTDARIVAATHRPLAGMVKTGAFREDLYFRLNVLSFELPPLSARPEDLPDLVAFLWNKLRLEMGKHVALPEAVADKLCRHHWPGNVRELSNVLERLMVLSGENGPDAGMLPPEVSSGVPAGKSTFVPTDELKARGLDSLVEEFEARLVADAMRIAENNQAKACEILKLTRGALQYKLRKYHGPEEEAA